MGNSKVKIILIVVILNLMNSEITSQNLNYSKGDELYTYALNGLKLREQPNLNSKVLKVIDFGQKVLITDVVKNEYDERIEIDKIKGNWVSINFNEITGFVFDGYLSKFPNNALSSENLKFRYLDEKTQEDPYEGHQMEKVLSDYIDSYFIKECGPVEYFDPQIGKGGLKLEITKLQNGYAKIIKPGWEGSTLALVMPNTRLSEIRNLILYLARKAVVYPNTFKEINESLQNINEYTELQQILNLSMFWINIKKYPENNTWSIEFLVASS